MIIERPQLNILSNRLGEEPRSLIFVSGPRRVGKTTMVQQAISRLRRTSTYLATDQQVSPVASWEQGTSATASTETLGFAPKSEQWLVEQWTLARSNAKALSPGQYYVLAIDEVQKIPRWSEVVKGLWDADRADNIPMHVVLLGSSAWLMQQGMHESLLGRFETIHLTHWSYAEMQQAFNVNLDEFIYFGGYPGSTHLYREGARWRQFIRQSMIEPNISLDIFEMVRVDKPASLRTLFELGCGAYSGQIVALTKLLGEVENAGNTVTLSRYLDLLSKAELLSGLEKFTGRPHRGRAAPPKFNAHNTALISALAGYDYENALNDRSHWGRLVESAVGAHLINSKHPDTKVQYWRESPDEVDFVLQSQGRLLAIEVKSGKTFAAPKGLDVFQAKFPKARTLLVGNGGIPIAEFLTRPADEWLD
ncbi:AAA family ATPase [Rhodoferax sp. GW822-FHT02A01]|uniref:ATP-binding protein n=1 Tax=Rhodoferax sp. GW822-FHT02A01 TaxID=3141537 RepID=UPI00315CD9CB